MCTRNLHGRRLCRYIVLLNICKILSDHFWGVNFDFCANFINQNSFCDIRENTPKSYGMGLSPPPHTENVRSFVTFLLGWLP